jgi:hypothetical protein
MIRSGTAISGSWLWDTFFQDCSLDANHYTYRRVLAFTPRAPGPPRVWDSIFSIVNVGYSAPGEGAGGGDGDGEFSAESADLASRRLLNISMAKCAPGF